MIAHTFVGPEDCHCSRKWYIQLVFWQYIYMQSVNICLVQRPSIAISHGILCFFFGKWIKTRLGKWKYVYTFNSDIVSFFARTNEIWFTHPISSVFYCFWIQMYNCNWYYSAWIFFTLIFFTSFLVLLYMICYCIGNVATNTMIWWSDIIYLLMSVATEKMG